MHILNLCKLAFVTEIIYIMSSYDTWSCHAPFLDMAGAGEMIKMIRGDNKVW